MVLLTSPHFLLVTRVGILRVHPETSVLKATSPPRPPQDAVWRICDSATHRVGAR